MGVLLICEQSVPRNNRAVWFRCDVRKNAVASGAASSVRVVGISPRTSLANRADWLNGSSEMPEKQHGGSALADQLLDRQGCERAERASTLGSFRFSNLSQRK